MRPVDWISLIYFATLSVMALVRPLAASRRARICATGVSVCATIPWLAGTATPSRRGVLAMVLILLGYYLSGCFAVNPSVRFEGWLLSWDERLLKDPATRFARWPRLLLALLEVVYMGCFLLVPAGVIALNMGGATALSIDRYWAAVVAAEFGSFVSLAFVYARPPWALEHRAALPDRAVHRAATRFVEGLTTGANTFPSGHAAGSVAVALGVIAVLPVLGVVLLGLAAAICLAAVIGRYHYSADVIAGVLLALAIFAMLG